LKLFLVHHADAVAHEVDTRRPLSALGEAQAARLADAASARGVRPAAIWHSGKLRARQTAQALWRACNALAEFAAVPNLQPADAPFHLRDRLVAQDRDILIAGHFPHLQRLLSLLVDGQEDTIVNFPSHGMVALETDDGGRTWREIWRVESAERPEQSS
jgi:phosphohistidine phosphatase